MQDPIVQSKTCLHCQSTFDISQGDLDFYSKISPTFANPSASGTSPGQGSAKFLIPTPTLCPDCRQRRRMTFRNERNLYRRTCDASGKQIISMYRPNNGYKVYDQKVRYSDSRNALDYGQEFDFSKTFTENFRSLSLQVPRPSMYNYFAENSEYCNCTNYQKNCYLTSASGSDEECMYASYIERCMYCLDCMMCFDCQYCYMSIDCEKSFGLQYASNCRNCSESFFLTNCNDCSFCRNCDRLENQKYCIDNIQYSKEEYLQKISAKKTNGYVDDIALRKSKKQEHTILFSEYSTGSHIRNSRFALQCVDANDLEHCKYCTWFSHSRHSMDNYSRGQNSELCYENVAIGENTYGVLFSANVDNNSRNILYSMHCRSCINCFACCGLSGQQYCIFNKQYTKEEYEKTVAKIIAHMIETGERGEFFHPSLSPIGYNETVAQEYYPLQKLGEEGELGKLRLTSLTHPTSLNFGDFGYHRSHYESPKPVSDKVIPGKDLPERIEDVEDSILQYAIACEVTGKLFRIQSQELAFYRNHGIPLPRKHPDQRHLERLALRK